MLKEIYIRLLTPDPIFSPFSFIYTLAINFTSCWLLFFTLSNSNVCYIFISLCLIVVCAAWVETCRLPQFPPPLLWKKMELLHHFFRNCKLKQILKTLPKLNFRWKNWKEKSEDLLCGWLGLSSESVELFSLFSGFQFSTIFPCNLRKQCEERSKPNS